MESFAVYLNNLPSQERGDPLVIQAATDILQMDLERKQQALRERMAVRVAKPYLHAVESDKLGDTCYDEVVRDISPVSSNLGTLYLHIPFCVKRCAHCHYYKEIGVSSEAIRRFPAYLGKEIALVMRKFGWDEIRPRSIHFGGGTPSVLETSEWNQLFADLRNVANVELADEVTIECSPEDATREKLQLWRDLGVNRISLGTQSFGAEALQILGRNHAASTSISSYSYTVEAGFENVNVDLMYGMPGRTLSSWLSDIRKILVLLPESVTVYATRPDPADTLERFEEFPSDIERIFCHLVALNAFLSAGYMQYSPNQFIRSYKGACGAKRERNRCHNVLGLGPLAHSIMKSWFYYTKANLARYQSNLDKNELGALKGAKMLRPAEQIRYMQFGLKLSGINKPVADNGILKAEYEELFGEPVEDSFNSELAFLLGEGLVITDMGNLRLTKSGVLLTRDVVRYFATAI